MKKIYSLFLVLFIANYIYSQDSHIEFKGISLDGSLSSFVEKMEKNGFTLQKSPREHVALMKGLFTGKWVEVLILSSPKTKTVWKVSVYYSKQESWTSLKSDYNEMVELFTKKYGEPKDHFEFFSSPYYEGDGYELQALRKEKCNYISFWTLDKGGIIVDINQYGQIQVRYEDKVNVKIKEKEDDENSLNDI